MKIVLIENAADYLYNLNMVGTMSRHGGYNIDPKYINMIRELEDFELEVETEFLFSDQFNIKDLRIQSNIVAKVIDDVRIGIYKSLYNGRCYTDISGLDKHERAYLVRFVPHPNKIVRETGAVLYELAINDQRAINIYSMLCRENNIEPMV